IKIIRISNINFYNRKISSAKKYLIEKINSCANFKIFTSLKLSQKKCQTHLRIIKFDIYRYILHQQYYSCNWENFLHCQKQSQIIEKGLTAREINIRKFVNCKLWSCPVT
ncbi:hypothetical protein L9F63_013460, partial [Diploptera punctata]